MVFLGFLVLILALLLVQQFKRLWLVQQDLWVVFWVYGFAVIALILLGYAMLIAMLSHSNFHMQNQSVDAVDTQLGLILLYYAAYLFMVPLLTLSWGTVVLGCSDNIHFRMFKYIAIVIAVFVLVFSCIMYIPLPRQKVHPIIIIPYAITGLDILQHNNESKLCFNKIHLTNPSDNNYYTFMHNCVNDTINKKDQ